MSELQEIMRSRANERRNDAARDVRIGTAFDYVDTVLRRHLPNPWAVIDGEELRSSLFEMDRRGYRVLDLDPERPF